MNFIDLFAGAGGLSEGFKQAGFYPIAHVEVDKGACFTLKTRAAYYYLKKNKQENIYLSYLKGEISRKEFYEHIPGYILDSVINARIGPDNKRIFASIERLQKNKEVDLIVGGPPCQAYSYIGRAALKDNVKNDERNFLYIKYARFLERYKPKLFVFENVPGLKTANHGRHYKNLIKRFDKAGYVLDDRLLNALNFGVIQNRERLIIMGWRKDIQFKYPNFTKSEILYTRDDIFMDLPAIPPHHTEKVSNYINPPNDYLKLSGLRNGMTFVTQHITRPHNKKDLEIYRLAIQKLEVEGKRLKNNEIPESKRTQSNTEDFLDRFKVVDRVPHTIIAHISKDGHHFIHPSKEQLRSISVREAARIQSFPDDYFFEGEIETYRRTAAFRQIGNAVPPIMAREIASTIKSHLQKVL